MELKLAAILGGTLASVLRIGWSLGGTLAGTATAKDWASGVRARAPGRLSLPENRHLIHGIRTAHLTAIDRVARCHAGLTAKLPTQLLGGDEASFAVSLRDWLDQRLRHLSVGKLDLDLVREADVQHVLNDLAYPSSIEGHAEASSYNRSRVEQLALAEIEAEAGVAAPVLFQRMFAGEDAPGWYDTFALFVAEQIKSNEGFRSLFFAAEFGDLARLAGTSSRLGAEVEAFRLSVEECRRGDGPRAWATAQANLGNALRLRGLRQAGTACEQEAVLALRLALKERPRDRFASEWAATQANLGSALQVLGLKEAGTGRLTEAVAAYRLALEEAPQDRRPQDWAMIQRNLGNTLRTLADRDRDPTLLNHAIVAYHLTLKVWRPSNAPNDWAMVQCNLAEALEALGDASGRVRLWHLAYQHALAGFRAFAQAGAAFYRDHAGRLRDRIGTKLRA